MITALDLSVWDMIGGDRGPAHLTCVEQRRKCTDPGLTSLIYAYCELLWQYVDDYESTLTEVLRQCWLAGLAS